MIGVEGRAHGVVGVCRRSRRVFVGRVPAVPLFCFITLTSRSFAKAVYIALLQQRFRLKQHQVAKELALESLDKSMLCCPTSTPAGSRRSIRLVVRGAGLAC